MSLIERIKAVIVSKPDDLSAYNDLFNVCRNSEKEDFETAHKTNEWLRSMIAKNMSRFNMTDGYNLYKRTLLFDAPYNFDCYLLYLEIEREPKERFYQPRRKIMKQLVDALQDLADDKLDELFISMPPRVGKTSLLMFFVTWIIGRNSEQSNLYSAYSDTITSAFYNGVLEVINDPVTYLWHDVFPSAKIVSTNSKDETLNIDRKKRYPSMTCRSLYGTLNGACDCNGFLISDDLIGGIEEALNKDRLIAAWSKVDNNFLPRAKETAKVLWCGTRWSMVDPAGIRMELLNNDERFKNRRFKIINLPALNDDDESNFNYAYNVGFSTEYYKQRRASFERNNDMASWLAQYMGEPIEREGTLFNPQEFRYFNGELPTSQPDRVFMTVDPAYGGGDFVAAPIVFKYDDDLYIPDVVYTNDDKRVSIPLLVDAFIKYGVTTIQFEETKATQGFREEFEKALKERGHRGTCTGKSAPTNKAKEQRIFDKAPDIREHMIFVETGHRKKHYELFMQNVFSFKMFGKNKHDDAPDSLSMAADMAFGRSREVVAFKRPF